MFFKSYHSSYFVCSNSSINFFLARWYCVLDVALEIFRISVTSSWSYPSKQNKRKNDPVTIRKGKNGLFDGLSLVQPPPWSSGESSTSSCISPISSMEICCFLSLRKSNDLLMTILFSQAPKLTSPR